MKIVYGVVAFGLLGFFLFALFIAHDAVTGLIEGRPDTIRRGGSASSTLRDRVFDGEDIFTYVVELLFAGMIIAVLVVMVLRALRKGSDGADR
ncbi:hypothetical protein [Pontivivens ytuae]|uniref:Uncharacterized protein n=1 Tax=Pontivivens ytuae TaxID=2789856 RepID=A0A7S9LNF5_9RHOB|nr:hypothetical protein [Pontivivens ytuae]QPH52318.1 hypothetical protein I0K15_10820 [Pontivivens ytuae]